MPTVKQIEAMVNSFDWDAYNEDLRGDLADIGGNIVKTQGARAASVVGVDQFSFDDPFVQKHFTRHVGNSIKSIDGTTRQSVKQLIRTVVASSEGATATELGDLILDKVRESFAGYEDWRADTIARTETADLYNMGNLAGYKQGGVDKVRVSDGDDDEECRKADGQIWTLEFALANRIAHPNCERDFSPIVE